MIKTEDRAIVSLYWARSEAALAEAQTKYGDYCRRVAADITGSEADADEIVNDVLKKSWDTIPPAKPDNLRGYLGMLSRQLSADRLRILRAKKRGADHTDLYDELDECIPDACRDMAGDYDLKRTIDRFLASLSARQRTVFMRRYWYARSVPQVALDCGISEEAVKAVCVRCRRKLRKMLEKEGIMP